MKDIRQIVKNRIKLNEHSVWVPGNVKEIKYSDGALSELYLEETFLQSRDLSSDSNELKNKIKDWPSEYHLSNKRSQLIRGFKFDRSKKVLEVGCGCGAITQFLGETFNEVVAIEGSMARAKLARLRTKNLPNVSVICGPFQSIEFRIPFDIIFCIGVFEYSNAFVDAENPHDHVLKTLSKMLAPEGTIVIAIENQFGLKYFSSSKEDHSKIMFDGIEGYPFSTKGARTFGYTEIREKLEKAFSHVEFFFPFPDYKLPDCIVSESFLKEAKIGELLGKFPSRDYAGTRTRLFDENLALLELDRNNYIPLFANSFLILAGRRKPLYLKFEQLGIVYSSDRAYQFNTLTKFIREKDGSVWSRKESLAKIKQTKIGMLTHRLIKEKWIDGLSIQAQIIKKAKDRKITINELLSPAMLWIDMISSLGAAKEGKLMIGGAYLDCIWKNSFIEDEKCILIDQEWEWLNNLSLNFLVIRAAYNLLQDLSMMRNFTKPLKRKTTKTSIKMIAKSLGVDLDNYDFKEFCEIESQLMHIVYEANQIKSKIYLKLNLINFRLPFLIIGLKKAPYDICQRLCLGIKGFIKKLIF